MSATLKPIDITNIAKRYKGKWIALSRDMKKVYISGSSAVKVREKAVKSGHSEALITKLPQSGKLMLL